ncbi:MAG TPA: hypothetical protein DCR27_01520 [Lachnospiraceae bacterium]|nr:hypothetical protein [Lachnospiraceae bacterium]
MRKVLQLAVFVLSVAIVGGIIYLLANTITEPELIQTLAADVRRAVLAPILSLIIGFCIYFKRNHMN